MKINIGESLKRLRLHKGLAFLCQKIDAVSERQVGTTPSYIQLGLDFTPKASTDDMLEQIKAFLAT